MEVKYIYHLTTRPEWDAALKKGFYVSQSLSTEGFIHCSTAAQVAPVLERYFKNVEGIIKLKMEVSKLTHAPIVEFVTSVNDYFPHIYGPINLEAVIAVEQPTD